MHIRNAIHTRALSTCTLCLIALLVTACDLWGHTPTTPARPTKAPTSAQTYTVPETDITDFDTLDPALAHDPASLDVIQMLYTGLVSLNDQLQIQPQLASSWQMGSDGKMWTFYLKPHLKFSDGSNLTATDVAYSLDRALQPTTKSTVAPLYLNLLKDSDQLLAGHRSTLINDSILTPNSTTIVLITSTPAAYFLQDLAKSCAFVVEKKMVQKYGSHFTDYLAEGGETGPFKVSQYVHGSSITLIPNADYADNKPQLQKVTFVIYHSIDAAYQDYLSNKLDTTTIPANMVASEKKSKDFVQVNQFWINYYAMNYLTKPFNNIHIRQAFALAIDKQDIVKNIWNNSVIATNHIVPAGMPGYNASLTGPDGTQNLSGNAKMAQTLLLQGMQEEHWSNLSDIPTIHLTYVAGISTEDQEVATLIQEWQTVLHIQVIPNPVDYQTLLDKVTGATNNAEGIQMWGLSWIGEYPDPEDWLTRQFGRGSNYNNMNYGENSSANAAKEQATQQQLNNADDNIKNSAARLQSYQQAEQEIVNDVGWIPMEQEQLFIARDPALVGFVNNGQNIIPPDDWANIYRIY